MQPLPNCVEVFTAPSSASSAKSTYRLEPGDFSLQEPAKRRKEESSPYLLLGFDTEFKTPDTPVSREDIAEGRAKYEVLSYQFCAKISDGRQWDGICCPERGERVSLAEFISFALATGARHHGIDRLPTTIYLVGHFTRADVPAFADFQDMTALLSSVRSTFISVDNFHPYELIGPDGKVPLRIYFRDTWLLAPASAKGLKALGDLVGVPKLQLDSDPAVHRRMIQQMDVVRDTNWELFRRYAINDAHICVRYIENITAMYERVTNKKKVPLTLTSIGVDLLLKSWQEDFGLKPANLLGKEAVKEKYFDKVKGHFRIKDEQPYISAVYRHVAFVSETYHGGRNEQFWFGPGFEDNWSDWDLSSAYPSAMSLIGRPRWHEIYVTTDLDAFRPTTLGFAEVDFEFPPDTRYPTLPVRTANGLLFPLSGTSNCAAPEIAVAQSLGAKLTLKYGVIVPTSPDTEVFGLFIKKCLEERKKAGSKTLTGLLWKEIGNSTYGKTAQGLMKKRVYDLRDRATKPLPPSRITNPFFASFITSFVRALLGEIINSLGQSCVFSCTTDGFLTNATLEQVNGALDGPLATIFASARNNLTGDSKVLEVKHAIRQPLGWRTRGQATLLPGLPNPSDPEHCYVLAKGGIYLDGELTTVEERNTWIVDRFFTRTPSSIIDIVAKTGIRDIVEHDADLVEKALSKRLSMEFDWKRRPLAVGFSDQYQHVLFSTQPWRSVDQFVAVRNAWDEVIKSGGLCIQTIESFNEFATYIDTHVGLPKQHARYLKKENPDLNRLRSLLCSAWKQSEAGLSCEDSELSASEFAKLLTEFGIPCTKADVENGKKRPFIAQSCPPTSLVREKLEQLGAVFPALEPAEFLHFDTSRTAISIRPTGMCPYVLLAVQQQTAMQKAA